jgi:hypothetical protein
MPKPDLSIANFEINPPSPMQGEKIQANIAVKNQGEGTAAGFSVYWQPYEAHSGLSKPVSSLNPGQSKTLVFEFVYPEPGDFQTEAIADPDNRIGETDEANNSSTQKVTARRSQGRGRYRIVINGFTVNHETWDHALEVDGKGDEVYFSAIVQTLNKNGDQLSYSEPRTKTMGDINGFPGRVQAGSRSDKGGLKTDDTHPTSSPWLRTVPPQPDRSPWLVWEAELLEDETAVTVIPSIFEYDGGTDAFNEWTKWGKTTLSKIKSFLGKIFGPVTDIVFEGVDLGLDIAVSMGESGIVGQAQDRPIGMKKEGEKYNFKSKVVTLTYEKAEWLIKNNPAGKGNGILELRYVDEPRLAGDYSFYIQVEKVQ